MKNKLIEIFVCMLLIGTILPASATIKIEKKDITTKNDGTLSGYVNDTSMNPIEGALVRVYFHGTYEEDYTDASGYYHVTNIPICYCLKNCTASKPGYKSEWVLLGIVEDTTYDFVLTCGNILYVGGSGPGNYSKIQDAIDNATDGDTVYVFNGNYPENLNINVSIYLKGERRYSTIIDGNESKDVVHMSNDYITINSFLILGGMKVMANSTIISENIIVTQLRKCIYMADGFGNSIVNNTLISDSNGMTIEESYYTYISGNKVESGGPGYHGILIFDSHWSTIRRNIIDDCIFGIPILNGTNNIITENKINANVSGIYLWGEPDSKDCSSNIIFRNDIRSHNYSIFLYSASKNDIIENNFISRSPAQFRISSHPSVPPPIDPQNKWSRNYWNRPRILPKIIFGQIKIGSKWVPIINIDWHPAQKRYIIEV